MEAAPGETGSALHIVAPLRRPGGVLIPREAGRSSLQAGFSRAEGRVDPVFSRGSASHLPALGCSKSIRIPTRFPTKIVADRAAQA